MITGGYSPNRRGELMPFASRMDNKVTALLHRRVTSRVHYEGGKICLQLLHSGRYGYTPYSLSPSGIKSPITPFKTHKMNVKQIESTIDDFVQAAELGKPPGVISSNFWSFLLVLCGSLYQFLLSSPQPFLFVLF